MTYALSWPLQEALFSLIKDDPACIQFFGSRIYDFAQPFGQDAEADGPYLIIGDEEARDWSTGTDDGAVHTVRLDVWASQRSFDEAKRAAGAVSDAILSGDIVPSRGQVINARFIDAKTRRTENDSLRGVQMRFRIVIEDTL